jgi:hypothetical protein
LSNSLQDLITVAKRGAKYAQEQFKHEDDDWEPMLLAWNRDGQLLVTSLGAHMTDDAAKDRLAEEVIPQAIRDQGITALVMVLSAWTAHYTPDEEKIVRPSEHPNRVEILEVFAMDRFDVVTQLARIRRHQGCGPSLSEWEVIDAKSITGRFVEPIRRALTPQG